MNWGVSGCNHDPESASQFGFQLRQQMVATPSRKSSRVLVTAAQFTFTRKRTSTYSSSKERRGSCPGTRRSTPRRERWLASPGVSRTLGKSHRDATSLGDYVHAGRRGGGFAIDRYERRSTGPGGACRQICSPAYWPSAIGGLRTESTRGVTE